MRRGRVARVWRLGRNQQSSVVDNGNHYRRNRGASTVSPDERGSNSSCRKITLSRCRETERKRERANWEDSSRAAGKRSGEAKTREVSLFSPANSDVLTLSTTGVRSFAMAKHRKDRHWRDWSRTELSHPLVLPSFPWNLLTGNFPWNRIDRGKILQRDERSTTFAADFLSKVHREIVEW